MRKLFIQTLFIMLCCMGTLPVAAQSMSDTQVLEYVKQGLKEGKDQRVLATELARKGVTEEQARRVKELYDKQNNTATDDISGTAKAEARLREQVGDDSVVLMENNPKSEDVVQEDQVFGRNIFNTRNLTFEPSINIATPPNYRLGPGDEVIIDIWGASENTIRQQISPDGTINIGELGPLYLSGMTVEKAQDFLTKELRKIYSDTNNQIRVTLGNTRTIQINVMGEVVQPGTYALSAFSTVFHALYRAGGVNDIGSLRKVQLVRNGKKMATIDVYDFIMHGRTQDDIRLEEGDVVIVPTYESLVQISGNVKRPMRYEMKNGETVETLIGYAGGFTSDAYTKSLRMVRQNGKEYQVNTIDDKDYGSYRLSDGDMVTAEAILDRFTNKLEIRGAVYRPGIYELNDNVNTVKALIARADSLTDDAFTTRAVLYRLRDNMTREVKQIDVAALINGTIPDIVLQRNDVLFIPSIHDINDWGDVEIAGEVIAPGTYPYADNMTLEDLVIAAGGLKESASLVRVDVARRIKNPTSAEDTKEIGEMFTFSLKDGFVVDGEPGFVLQPYDHVYVRRSPAYSEQKNVAINGEILYGGTYTLTSKDERISDLVKKAGGTTQFAYVRGAKLVRRANANELQRMQDVVVLLRRQMGDERVDSLGIKVDSTFSVGIDLEAALKAPGSDADIILREGDVVVVPKYNNTVRINGAVMQPNVVSYKQGKDVKYYIGQAGGYNQVAKKNKKYIIYMNGQIAAVKRRGKNLVEPGCEIIVPNKRQRQANWGNVLSSLSAVSSIGTMAATIANLVK
ncbi:MAG TPA: SLBB domain-containing protein [Candidatus Caccoplasma intestinavium]|uniref:SLBB domain-containing protein n=1 Tax=Candidatus Caccoplasma intestinavium TaxID=2840716 RepID=A0A9D1KCR1_9BACT|nr:SLBB domain-containing protein [Candidatus Caccoplasma intestinavium]